MFRTIETGRNRTELPVNWRLGFEAAPKLYAKANKLAHIRAFGMQHIKTKTVFLLFLNSSDQHAQQQIPAPPIDWSHVSGLVPPLELCAKRWLGEMTNCSEVLEAEALALAGSSLNFLAAVYENWTKQVSINSVSVIHITGPD